MYTTVAAGMVADELPKDLVNKFLEAIQEGEHTIYHGIAPPQQEEYNDQEMPEVSRTNTMQTEKKRGLDEVEGNETKSEALNAENLLLKRKSVTTIVKEPPKGMQSLNAFFKPKVSK